MADRLNSPASTRRGWIPTFAFGTTLCVWAMTYFLAMPGVDASPWLLIAITGVALFAAGTLAGRSGAARGIAGGIALGCAITAINLLILGSFGSGASWGDVVHSALPWIGGFLIAATVLCTIGVLLGRAMRPATPAIETSNAWIGRFALVVAGATLLLITAGGVVTSTESGMAVPDWLTTFGYPMFLYPLELMQQSEGTYIEHFHRLWGLLVGLSSLTLTIYLWRYDRRGWVRWFVTIVFLLVIVQGIFGGTRVTENRLVLAIIHGVFGQALFAALVCLAAFTSNQWMIGKPAEIVEKAKSDYALSASLVAALLIQILLGAIYRHLSTDENISEQLLFGLVNAHMGLGILIAVKLIFVGIRAFAKRKNHQPLSQLGLALMILTPLQVALGLVAYVLVEFADRKPGDPIPTTEVLFTTSHQVTGALILVTSALLFVWTRRLLRKN